MAKSNILMMIAVVISAVVLPAMVSGSRTDPASKGFLVVGRVFCDTCLAGFETPASTYIADAKVKVECRRRDSDAKTCTFEGVTDSTGTYKIQVANEHENEICEASLVSSPDSACAARVVGRDVARVFLSHNNGISSDTRLANNLGFRKEFPLAWCAEMMKMYQSTEDLE